jgi:hypothetical protein
MGAKTGKEKSLDTEKDGKKEKHSNGKSSSSSDCAVAPTAKMVSSQ